ncbi:MAG: triphosphoribosyl-dephospho-CoA synthase, partial [Firmicutes bacterium]|nr:triphosphoribosyl-dephospho-CoA synthase [Bacillota bacterium]
GLVDHDNNGAHTDMNHFMFLRSALALRPCFVQCADLGLGGMVSTDELRQIGLAGETAMFEATGGVNTHKGLVFSLGILCTACGILLAQKYALEEDNFDGAIRFDGEELRTQCAAIAKALLLDDVGGETHGEVVRRETGISGVKGEALSGFETAFTLGLPVLRDALDRVGEMNEACVETLIHLLAKTDDSNLVYRGGLEGLEFVRTRAEELLSNDPGDMDAIRELDRECIERNLSPGGCADLLAITIMLHLVVK